MTLLEPSTWSLGSWETLVARKITILFCGCGLEAGWCRARRCIARSFHAVGNRPHGAGPSRDGRCNWAGVPHVLPFTAVFSY